MLSGGYPSLSGDWSGTGRAGGLSALLGTSSAVTRVADRTDAQVLADIGGALIDRRPIVCETPPAFGAPGAGAGVGIRSNHAYAPSAVTDDAIILQDPNDHRPRRVPVATFRAPVPGLYDRRSRLSPTIRPRAARCSSRHTRPRPMLAPVERGMRAARWSRAATTLRRAPGVAMLRAGGSAAHAALAASAARAVTWPQHCGPGGACSRSYMSPATDEPAVLNASGRAGSGADPGGCGRRARACCRCGATSLGDRARLRRRLGALHERFGRLALADVLEPARRMAADGFPANPLLRMPPPSCRPWTRCARPMAAGHVLRRPGTAMPSRRWPGRPRRLLRGTFGEALLALGRRRVRPRGPGASRGPTGSIPHSVSTPGATTSGRCPRAGRAT